MSSLHLLKGQSAPESPNVPAPAATDPGVETLSAGLGLLLEDHKQWVESQGEAGRRLELSRANFAGKDLIGTNLRGAVLNQADFSGADLLLADLSDACLNQANFRAANLLGADFRGAQLQGANLEGTTGLAVRQLAETNLQSALLPRSLEPFEGLAAADLLARRARWLLIALATVCVLSWVRIRLTSDAHLLRNLPALPVPYLSDFLPIVGFFLAAPCVLAGLYLFFHLCLHRLRDRLDDLPAVFPDGRCPDKSGPWVWMGILRIRSNWQSDADSSGSLLEKIVPALVSHVMVPGTLLLFWGRYLIMQELRSSMLHVFLAVVLISLASFSPQIVRSSTAKASSEQPNPRSLLRRKMASWSAVVALSSGALLALLTLGVIYGAPNDSRRTPDSSPAHVARWAAEVFTLIGYNPYPDLTESSISARPTNWSGRDEELSAVRGAALNRVRLRYAEAYRTFWVNAHLWEANLEGAYLSESDLRGANLRQANLRFATLDRAALFHANFHSAELEQANLTGADMRSSELSYATLEGATLVDTKLEGANLFSANLRHAQLTHADFARADLRKADLQNAEMASADLRNAYLWSARLADARLQDAELQGAILIEADLRRADLRGAALQGTVLRAVDLTGANLEGADLRGAFGITANQVCSAGERRGVQLDEGLARLVDTQCSTIR